jgi:hypothetical protein
VRRDRFSQPRIGFEHDRDGDGALATIALNGAVVW